MTHPTLRRRSILALAILVPALGGAPPAPARTYARPDLVTLSVVDRATGGELQSWRSGGRVFVAGEPGARYGLRLSNRTGQRVLAVLSVDGVNVLSGETAGYDGRGYVLDPYETYDINGWRKSNQEIAAFAFASLSQSYAARTGRPADVGVMGMAVFRERAEPPPPPVYAPPPVEWSRRSRRAEAPPGMDVRLRRRCRSRRCRRPCRSRTRRRCCAAPRRPSPPPGPRPRTPTPRRSARSGSAPRTARASGRWCTTCRSSGRARSQQQLGRIEYDTYAHLVAKGVIPLPRYIERRPRPFPLEPGRGGFVPDPPGGA